MHRNLSAIVDDEVCDDLVKEDIVTPLSAMLRDCVSKFEETRRRGVGEEESGEMTVEGVSGGRGKGSAGARKAEHQKGLKVDIEQQKLSEVLEQGLHLLWNVR